MKTLDSLIFSDVQNIAKEINFSKLNAKKILITGATGIVGTYLVSTLKAACDEQNIKIKLYISAQTEPSDYFRNLLPVDTQTFLGDITDIEYLRKIPEVDYIIHASGYGQPQKFMQNQQKTIEINTTSLLYLFRKLNTNGSLLFISSSEVYSGLTKPPFNEEQIGSTNTTHKRACYIEGKRCGEAIINSFRENGFDTKSARLSLAYGPGTKRDDARVLNNFIYKGLNGKIDLLDQGKATRTYCYITDAVKMLWNILLFGKDPIYNVAGESKTTIAELATKISKITNSEVLFPENSNNALVGAPNEVYLDISKVKKQFNINNLISLDDGLERTVEWQKVLYNK